MCSAFMTLFQKDKSTYHAPNLHAQDSTELLYASAISTMHENQAYNWDH